MTTTYKKARLLPCDVFLSSHTIFYNMEEKYNKLKTRKPGDPNPFVDPKGYLAHVDEYDLPREQVIQDPSTGRDARISGDAAQLDDPAAVLVGGEAEGDGGFGEGERIVEVALLDRRLEALAVLAVGQAADPPVEERLE